MDNEAQLVSVIGHEIGQVTALDAVSQMSRQQLAQFNQNYPSTVPLDELALINHLSGPGSSMPSNFPAKRVVEHR